MHFSVCVWPEYDGTLNKLNGPSASKEANFRPLFRLRAEWVVTISDQQTKDPK